MKEHTGPIDLDVIGSILLLRKKDKPDPLVRILNLYSEHSLNLVQRIQDALHQSDASLIREIAHSLKSSSGNVGAMKLASLCHEMEKAGLENDLEMARQLFPQMLEEHREVEIALSRYLDDHPQ